MSIPHTVDQELPEPEPEPEPEQTVQPSPHSTIDVNVDNLSDPIPLPPTVDIKADASSDKFCRFLPSSSFLFLVFTFFWSAYNARPDDVSFVFLCYTILFSLLYCLRKYERLDADAPRYVRTFLKAAILLHATGLNVVFACRAAELVSWPFAAVIWASAAFVALIGFFALFVWSNRVDDGALPYSKLDSNSNSNSDDNNNCKEEEGKHFFDNELSPEDKA